MSKPKPEQTEPSIDDMLTSIREAIHEETAREAEEHARTFKTKQSVDRGAALSSPSETRTRDAGVSGSMRGLRVSLQPADANQDRGRVTARSEDFLSIKNKLASLRQSRPPAPTEGKLAGIMGGDMRLEDALARMKSAEQLQRRNAPSPSRGEDVSAREQQSTDLAMRSGIDDIEPHTDEMTFAPVEEFDAEVEPAATSPGVPADWSSPSGTGQPDGPPSQTGPVDSDYEHADHGHTAPQGMLSPHAAMAAGTAFERLSEEILARARNNETIFDDTAREMLKPMLTKWLDDHLPSLVERLVREEIERVARRGGR